MMPIFSSVFKNESCSELNGRTQRERSGPFLLSKDEKVVHGGSKGFSWHLHEQIYYFISLDFFNQQNKKVYPHKKSGWKLFEDISQVVGSRNANQCRMFHKKLLEGKSVEQVIEWGRKNIKNYDIVYEKEVEKLEKIFGSNQLKDKLQKPIILIDKQSKNIQNQLFDKKEEDLIPTATDYTKQASNKNNHSQKSRHSFSLDQTKNQASLSIISKPFSHYSSLKINEESNKMTRQQLWIDCHEAFLNWTTKLNSLAIKSNSFSFF